MTIRPAQASIVAIASFSLGAEGLSKMAYNFTSFQSCLSHDSHFIGHLSSQCSHPPFRSSTLSFPVKHSVYAPQVSLQQQTSISNPQVSDNPDEKNKTSSKVYIWVNPKSSKAPQLRKSTFELRYDSLVKISRELDSFDPLNGDFPVILGNYGSKFAKQDAAIILNNMSNPETAILVLRYFQERLNLSKEVVLYNVTLKVLRKARDFYKAEKLFAEMTERGVKPDNITFSTIISCARQFNLPEKALELFEKMPSFGCEPDNQTYSVMIDSYGKVGNVDMAFQLYDRARSEKWHVDAVTFATLIKLHGTSGNFDGCLSLYEEMKALGVKPNMAVYNTLIDAMGRAKRPWQAKTIYKDLLKAGSQPTRGTYAALIRAYGRARYHEDCLSVYREMKQKGMELNAVVYNTLLSMCADMGLTDEAIEIFQDMKGSVNCRPDSWSYSSMITIFSCSGKVSDAEGVLSDMLEAGCEPSIFVFTSLIQCYGKASRTDDVVKTFDQMVELGIIPDERFFGCLLNVMTQVPREELGKLTRCVEQSHSKLGNVVKLLVDGGNIEDGTFQNEACELFHAVGADVRKAYCNCLIDLCINLNMLERACELFNIGLTLEIYTDIQTRSPSQWSLHVKSLSLGAALTALHIWTDDLSRAFENGEGLPSLLGINTGHGKHKYSEKGLAVVFEEHLKELNAPFHQAPDKAGWFLTTKVAASSWLESIKSHQLVEG